VATEIKNCTCESKFQDEKYGKNMRVYNKTKKQDGKIYRCTVCGKEK